ncbi:hypothetical protein AMAG_17971 [Allomyces macrogynus ATCC 38327]|uniref:Uncharacterized protein n=1 Tax=Allomyces macrogynus (strain ATCC 38327) TaxID=578462 RepID=A0A0L0S2H8_ALLM3|nr:hypothetical protein AMAG_17971 [Allomyces macrogynus ATCC 38327]|eukprot:KNE56787.1 hypothetical protein AMAG_17971 [Allomyces macrogynus ATCC 38327]
MPPPPPPPLPPLPPPVLTMPHVVSSPSPSPIPTLPAPLSAQTPITAVPATEPLLGQPPAAPNDPRPAPKRPKPGDRTCCGRPVQELLRRPRHYFMYTFTSHTDELRYSMWRCHQFPPNQCDRAGCNNSATAHTRAPPVRATVVSAFVIEWGILFSLDREESLTPCLSVFFLATAVSATLPLFFESAARRYFVLRKLTMARPAARAPATPLIRPRPCAARTAAPAVAAAVGTKRRGPRLGAL